MSLLLFYHSLVLLFLRALSEVIGSPLPYDDVLSLRDRMWEISPTLLRYDTTEPTSVDVALAGLAVLKARTSGAKISGAALRKPISNFYQTDPISRAYVLSFLSFSVLLDAFPNHSMQVRHDGSLYALIYERGELRVQ